MAENLYTAEVLIYSYDNQGLIFELSKIFNEEKINLTGMNVRTSKNGKATMDIKFEIKSKEQLTKIMSKIRSVEGIIDIERTAG